MPFRDVVGHRSLIALLARSAEHGSLPPSLIFAGPSGVGKHLLAVATAQALNCLRPCRPGAATKEGPAQSTFDACGTCPACSRIARGVHPDVLLVSPGDSGSIKIDAVRDALESTTFRPFEGNRRVVIVDRADALVVAAQNALLKTLEEPRPSSVVILVTARPDALLATVRSRCPVLRFLPLAAAEVAAVLTRRGLGEKDAQLMALAADGSVGRALEAGDLIDCRDVAARVLSHAAASNDPRRRIEGAKDLLAGTGAGGAGDREQLAAHLRAMASLLRDVELLGAHADATALANADFQTGLDRLSAFHGERGVRAFETVDRALAALEGNAGVKVVADWVALNL